MKIPAKKLPLTLLSLLILLSSLATLVPTPSRAADCPMGPWYEQTPCQFYQKIKGGSTPDNEIFGERYTYAQINWIFNSLYNMVMPAGIGDEKDLQNFIQRFIPPENPEGGYVGPTLADYSQLGLPGLLLGGISYSLSSPPASGVQEIKSLASKVFDLGTGVQPVYAQGYGFDQLSVVQTLWKATRNMAYLISIILLIAAGFAVMFRIKINPQTVVTIQTMIPKLVITLLLITFSYAIAGLIIDLVYVVISAVLAFLAPPIGNVIHPTNLGNAISWFTSSSYPGLVIYFLLPWIIAILFAGTILNVFTSGLGTIVAVVFLIFAIFLVWNLFKIWWMLVKTQITLIFLIVVGPLQIMLDLIPGQSGFSGWFRNIIANASVFAVVPIMFILGMIFWRPFGGSTEWGQAGAIWARILEWARLNPLGTVTTGIGGTSSLPNLPFVSGAGVIFNLVAGYVILSLTPKVADMIRDVLKVPAFKYGTAFGEAALPITAAYKQHAALQEEVRSAQLKAAAEAGDTVAVQRITGQRMRSGVGKTLIDEFLKSA